MLVKRIETGCEFSTHTAYGSFIVTPTLADQGERTLRIVPPEVPVSFAELKLNPGTIEKIIRAKRRRDSQQMKQPFTPATFIDRPSEELLPQ